MNLILFAPAEYDPATATAALPPRDPRAIHLRKVLHVRAGIPFRAGLLDGPSGTAEPLTDAPPSDGSPWRFRCEFSTPLAPLPPIDILLAMPRPKVLPRLLEDLAALSFGTLWLLHARKTRAAYATAHQLAPDALRSALLAGLQQARRTRLPAIHILPDLAPDALPLPTYALRLLATPSPAPSRALLDDIRRLPPASRLLLAIGPEPGWTPDEENLLLSKNFTPFSLGPAPLRTHPAAIALLSALHLAHPTTP